MFGELLREFICPICGETPIDPIRLNIAVDSSSAAASAPPAATVCNEVFCEPCILQMFYFAQNNENTTLKCPICNQIICSAPPKMRYMSDKLSKKIIDYAQETQSNSLAHSCAYNCGFTTDRAADLRAHYTEEGLCHSRIVPCSVEKCTVLCRVGKEQYDHEAICPKKYIGCPFCIERVDKAVIQQHITEFHKINPLLLSVLNI